ncbi:MAG TPA: carboxypeptidase-like regulatory domain-containing protein, partial [Candidatus Angelobacter sp.]|nr:carboxypeptidase-like regulatory domain-containing protein [Candidatus Angelobacter sp.]
MKAVLLFSSLAFIVAVFLLCYQASAQTSSGTLQGVITDPTNAVVPGASVEIHNPVSGYDRTVIT